jgi:hypothetical protein
MVTGAAQIAVFGIVTTIEGYSYTITTAINGMFMPRISRLVADDKSDKALNKLLVDVGKFQFALNGLIIAGFAVVGRSFIDLWMGESFRDAYYGILLVIVPGSFFNALQIANTTIIVEGKVKLNIHEGTQHGNEFKLKGKGIQRLNYSGKGDQYVRIIVEVPKELSKAQKEKLREFETLSEEKNYKKQKTFMDKLKDFFAD